MANRRLNQDNADYNDRTVIANLVMTVGADGAGTTPTFGKDAVTSVTLANSTTYVIQLADHFSALLNVTGTVMQASWSATAGGAGGIEMLSNTVSPSGASTITIAALKGDGTQAALLAGDILYMTIKLKN